MYTQTCRSCRQILQTRLRQKIYHFQQDRQQPQKRYSSDLPDLSNSSAWYWDTVAPTLDQLTAARHFFQTHQPSKAWTAGEWDNPSLARKRMTQDFRLFNPEIVFLGRSNVGKSTLLNALTATPQLNHTGRQPGKTTMFHAWGLSTRDPVTGGAVKGTEGAMDTKMTVIDAPGYGFASDRAWGTRIMKYLRLRQQLRKVFVLINAQHGIMTTDQTMLSLLQQHNIPFQVIISKSDKLQPPSKRNELLRNLMVLLKQAIKGPPVSSSASSSSSSTALGEILAVGCGEFPDRYFTHAENLTNGVAAVQWAVLQAAGLTEFAMTRYETHSASKALDPQKPPPRPKPILSPGVNVADPTTWSVPSWLQDELLDAPKPKGKDFSLEAQKHRMSEAIRKASVSGSNAKADTSVPIQQIIQQLSEADSANQMFTTDQPLASAHQSNNSQNSSNTPIHNELHNTKSSSTNAVRKTPSQLEGILEAIGEPTKTTWAPKVKSQPPPSPPPQTKATTPTRTPPPPPPPTPRSTSESLPTGPGVTRGMDAFMAMMGTTPKKSNSQSQPTRRGSARGGRGSRGSGTPSPSSSSPRSGSSRSEPLTAQPVTKPVPTGPGVSRGMDALMAFTGASDVQTKSRRGGKSRRRH